MAKRVLHAMLALTTLAVLAALVLRVATTIRFGMLVPFPIDGPGLYTMWKVQRGFPMYEWPTRDFFALALYNFLFYEFYARILAVVGVPSTQLPIAAKLLTIPIAAMGAVVQHATVAGILKRRGIPASRTVLAAFAFCTWFGPGFIGPWAVSARPDVAASAFAVAAFAVCVSVVEGRAAPRLIIAGVLFYVAWAFKQSAVQMFAGVCLYFLMVRRSIQLLTLVILPFGILVALTIAFGGAAYRYDVFVAPSIARGFEWWTSWFFLRGVFLPNLPVWAALAFAAWRAFDARRDGGEWPLARDVTLLLACTLATTFVGAFVFMAKIGSALNHAFEFWIVSALSASLVYFAQARSSPSSERLHAIAAALFALPLLFVAAHLAGSERVIRALGLSASVERMRLGSAPEYAARAALVDRLRALPRPIHIDDEMLAQPWYANDDRYPAIVLDRVFYDAAGGRGLLENGGVLSLIERRYFGTVVAYVPPFNVFRAARSAGYVEVARLPWLRDDEAVVLVRSDRPLPDQIKRPTRRKTP